MRIKLCASSYATRSLRQNSFDPAFIDTSSGLFSAKRGTLET